MDEKHQLDRYEAGDLIHGRPEWKRLAQDEKYVTDLCQHHRETSHEGRLGATIGPILPEMMSGEIDTLSLLFKDKLLENVYRAGVGADIAYERMTVCIDALAHKNSNLCILEIGSGTGGATLPIMQTLMLHEADEPGTPRFASYDYTDISAGFFEKAQELFKDYTARMRFKTLDIEHDPIDQDSRLGKYAETVEAGRKVGTYGDVQPFGNEVYLCIWTSSRVVALGVDFAFRDFQDQRCHMASILVSTALPDEPPKSRKDGLQATIIASADSMLQNKVSKILKSRLEAQGISSCKIVDLHNIAASSLKKTCCIFLPELEESVLSDISSEHYAGLQKMVATADGMLWLTQGGTLGRSNPRAHLVAGLARCIRSENIQYDFVTLDFDVANKPDNVVKNTMDIFQQSFMQVGGLQAEVEYSLKSGVLYTNRVIEANCLNSQIARRTARGQAQLQKFGQEPVRPSVLSIASPGLLDTLQFVEDPIVDLPLADDEVEIEVKATGMNFLDIMTTLGRVSGDSLGVECAGLVKRVGRNSNLKVGSRVFGATKAGYATLVRNKASLVKEIPDRLSFAAAASLPIIYCTAYYAFFDVARMRAGESVLIHWAAGGVGQAAIQLAKLIGAEIYVTVGTTEKRDFVIKTYGIPKDHIFSSRDFTFVQGIKRMTKNRGVDVILNSMAGEGLRQSWDCLAPYGRFLEIGKRDIQTYGRLPMQPFSKNLIFAAIDLAIMTRNDPEIVGNILAKVLRLAAEKKIEPAQPLHIYSYSRIEDAFRFMQSGKHTGKIILEANPEDMVMAVPDSKPTYRFDPAVSYLISGGFGGLGRSMARWFVHRGARNLIILSRSGGSSAAAQSLIEELRSDGVRIACPPCNVSEEASLVSVLEECARTMPPIRGCIQGAMVLRDGVFENMTLEAFKAPIQPKLEGSWNLHKHLPKDLDFFVLLSSSRGITGNRAQANYATGNTYQDALAHHRVANGLKATSLDLGMILMHGCMAIKEEEYLTLLDYHCDSSLPLTPNLTTQVVTGLETPSSLRSQGIDEPFWMRSPLFRHLYQMGASNSNSATVDDLAVNIELLLQATDSPEAAATVIAEALVRKLGKALSIPSEDIEVSKPMHAYGVDSLVSVEIRKWFMKVMKADVAVFDIMGVGSIKALSEMVAARSALLQGLATGKEVEGGEQ
ncbi:hypothetical protein MMC18_006394 [Xylographa bjoerkii]|nr:hypothetical protein [Xylographa bjoerkii]